MQPTGARSEDAAALIARIAQGDRETFSRFYDALAGVAFGLIRRVHRDPGVSEEVLQEVFWQVWREASQYDAERGSPESWLLMRAKSRAIDRLRSMRRRDRTFVSTVDESVTRAAHTEGNPPGLAENRGLVERGLNRLPAAQRQVIELAFFEGLTQSEIAARLGEPLGTVKTRARLGLERLRSVLGEEGQPYDMNHEEIRELAAMYALGGLDGEDRARFEALLRSADPDATSALADFESALVSLATESAEPPPPSVKSALMARIAPEARQEPASAIAPLRRRRVLWPAVWAATMAAGIAAVVVGLAVSARYEKRLDALARESAALRADIDREQQIIAVLRDPATEVVALSGLEPAPSARARMFWNKQSGGLLVAAGLPPAPAGKTYQLWAIAGKNPPVSGGVFTVDARGTGSLRVSPLGGVGKVDVFAVTLEPAGGLPAPSGQMYLAGKS